MTKKKERQTKQLILTVQCAFDSSHIFEKSFEVLENEEKPAVSEVEAFCPFCGKMNTLTIKSTPVPDAVIEKGLIERKRQQ